MRFPFGAAPRGAAVTQRLNKPSLARPRDDNRRDWPQFATPSVASVLADLRPANDPDPILEVLHLEAVGENVLGQVLPICRVLSLSCWHALTIPVFSGVILAAQPPVVLSKAQREFFRARGAN